MDKIAKNAAFLLLSAERMFSSKTTGVFHGCEVVVANNMQAAREALGSPIPAIHVAICDLNLPDAHHGGELIDLMNECGVALIALVGAFGDGLRETMIKKVRSILFRRTASMHTNKPLSSQEEYKKLSHQRIDR